MRGKPTRAVQLSNFAVFQLAWFAAVLGAAHGARPAQEARLVAAACLVGFAIETAIVLQGHVAYPSGQPEPARG